ncbi:hypothetical protein [Rhodoplanes sp. Z2-YC6860]|uniref:hypothetical protein n=1 Tax=Rhodoplanes sp. Z2-YC6860 TaxID=674703 RepID=UPI000832FBDF|nr:hypothetical protein [Rhodoplanes sp. Z2-YC6860]
MSELRSNWALKIRRVDAEEVVRDELQLPAAAVQIVGASPADYRVEVHGGGTEAQSAAEQTFARLRRMYEIE